MRNDLRRLAHAGLTFNAPLSEERAAALVASLPISPGHHVLDLGCGWGELLLRILAAHPATTGTGVDNDQEALDRGVRIATRRGLYERVEFVNAEAAAFVDQADVVLCVGASHAFGTHGEALRVLRACVNYGGRVLFGDGYWTTDPSSEARCLIGDAPSLADLHAGVGAEGFRIEQEAVSTLDEWDRFEAAWRAGLQRSPDPEAATLAATRQREYEQGYRGVLGFAWLVLAPE